MLGDLNLNNHRITNLATPVTGSDSVNKEFLDNAISNLEIENKISKSGDAMNGDLNLSNHRITNLATPVAVSDSVNKEFLDNAIRNLIRFEGTPTYGSKLAIMGVNNEGRHVASITPIQVQGNNIYGLQKLIRLPDDIFRIENYTDNNASIELSDTLILKGLANPTEPNDAATKEFVENLVSNVGDNVRNSQNLDMNNYTIFNVGRPTESTSAINKRYFKRNTYRPKFQTFLGASNSPASTDSSSTFHTVRTNVDHILKLVSPPLVSGNDILTLRSDNINLTNEVEGSYIEITVSGALKVMSYNEQDKLQVNILRVRSGETQKISKTTITPPFDCFNLNCLVFPRPSQDVFRVQYNYSSSNTSISMNMSNVVIKVKLYDIDEQSER